MGFLTSTSATTVTAKLTPFGRQQLLQTNSNLITHFSLGDSDANYYGDLPLDNGRVPDISGEIGTNGTFNNGVYYGAEVFSKIIVNTLGEVKKLVASGSNLITIKSINNGIATISADTMTQLLIDRTLGDTDGNSNLFHSFGLPITSDEIGLYTIFTVDDNGYLSSAIEGINQDKVLAIAIDACEYGETLDGKSIKIDLQTTGATPYTIYSTFQKSLTPLTTVDNQVKENQYLGTATRPNIAYLFSDEVKKPNNNSLKSWGTGFGLNKPFSLNNKERFNPVSVSSTSTIVDQAVGIAYLDKGIIVITHQDIVNNYDTTSASTTTITYQHISNEVAQNVTCVVERDEFAVSNNTTHTDGEPIRVSEVALYDAVGNVIAFAKSNQQIIIGANQFLAVGVKILV
tara:strand:- start:1008 stop:2210 length:1203 start_codon:yes stop_codon:yes gene_type:complete